MGGQVLAGTEAPHGCAWFSSTQLSAESAPTMSRTAPVEMSTRLAPGAAPCSWVPSVSVVGRPAAVPLAGGPAGEDAVEVRAVAAAGDGVGVDAVRHLHHAAAAGVRLVEAEALVAGDDGAAAVGVLQEGVGGVDPGVDDRHRDAAAV